MMAEKKKRKTIPRVKPTGRPSKMNQEVCEIICGNIELGMPYKQACEAAGITYNTFLSWKAKGERALAELSPSKRSITEENCVNFLDMVSKAVAEGMKHNLELIRKSAEGSDEHKPDWKAAAFVLKNRHPDDFCETQKIDQKTEHSGGVSIQLNMKDCSKKGD